MKNFLADGKAVDITTPSGGLVSGQFCVIGKLSGVAGITSAEGEPNVLHREGMFTLPKATGSTWAVGDKLYWNGTAFTKTASTNVSYGIAMSVQGSSDTSGKVLLCNVPEADPA